MALDNILAMIANPKVADAVGSYQQGYQGSQQQQLLKDKRNLLQQQLSQGQEQEQDKLIARELFMASQVEGPQQDQILQSILQKVKNDPEDTKTFTDLASVPAGPERNQMINNFVNMAERSGLLVKPKAQKTAEQIERGVAMDEKQLGLKEREVALAEQKALSGGGATDTRTAEIKNYEYGKANPEFAALKKKADANKLTEHELRLATMLANGEIDASQLPKRGNTYNKIVAGAKELNPELDIRTATADYALSKNPAFRQKTMTAEVLPDIMKHVVDAGKRVDFSNIKAIGSFQKFYKENTNDPDLTEYMALRNDALMEIASVMRGAGMTDKAHEAEVEAMTPTLSPRALDAWVKAQTTALKPRLEIMRKIIHGKKGKTDDNDPLGIR